MTDAASKYTLYEYDAFGNLDKVTDPAMNVTTVDYEIHGFKER